MIATPYVESFLELSAKVNDAGLMQRRPGFYWPRILFWASGMIFALIAVVLIGDGWYLLFFAVFLGLAMPQLGFLSHEAAHQEIFEDRRWNEWTSRVLAGLFIGLSYGWWTNKHGRHHANPNKEGSDPDLTSRVLALSPENAHRRTGLAAKLARYQGWYFLPPLPFEGFSLHAATVKAILSRGRIRFRWVEILLVGIRLLGLPLLLFLVLPFWLAVMFILVQTLVFGFLLGGAFAASHIGMPVVPRDMKLDFLRRQVYMSRNIRGNPLVHFFMGGLQYQIEHHLFPRTPRPHLRALQKLVREHCSALGIRYSETTLREAYGVIIVHLNRVGLKNRDPYACPLALQLRA